MSTVVAALPLAVAVALLDVPGKGGRGGAALSPDAETRVLEGVVRAVDRWEEPDDENQSNSAGDPLASALVSLLVSLLTLLPDVDTWEG